MTENYGSPAPPLGTVQPESNAGSQSQSTPAVASEQARSVGQDAKEGTRHVVGVAKDETKGVAGDTVNQAKDLWDQTRSELTGQAGQQQQRLAGGLRSLADELSSMARNSEGQGLASDLAGRAAGQARSAAQYLDGRDPGSLVDELKTFARRRPGMFLAVAAGIGVLGGRLSRSMVDEHRDQAQDDTYGAVGYAGTGGYADTGQYAGTGGYAGTGDYVGTDYTSAARDTTARTPYTGVPPTATDPSGMPVDPLAGEAPLDPGRAGTGGESLR